MLGDIHGITKSRKLCNELFQVLRSSQIENHWTSVRMESVRMETQRFHCEEAAAWHGTPHAQIHFAPSHIQASSIVAGAAAAEAETKKRTKYADLPHHIAIETTGVWGSEGLNLVKELGRRIAIVQLEPRSTAFLRQRISLAIQRGNTAFKQHKFITTKQTY